VESYIKKGLLWILLFYCSFYCVTNPIMPISSVFKVDDAYIQLKSTIGKGKDFSLAVSGNKKLNFCTKVGGHSIKEKIFYTHRTLEELNNKCVYIELYELNYSDIKNFEDILKDKIIVY